MLWYITLFHGLKVGFEYLPDLGSKGTYILELACLRLVVINGVENVPSDVQDGD